MADFLLPNLGEGVESGDVLEILVEVGESVTSGQDVIELETDKATMFVASDVAGVVKAINCAEGDTLKVGQPVLTVEGSAAPAASPAPSGTCRPCDPSTCSTSRRSTSSRCTCSPGEVFVGRQSRGKPIHPSLRSGSWR